MENGASKMKFRLGFVTNSSSTNYTVYWQGEGWEIVNLLSLPEIMAILPSSEEVPVETIIQRMLANYSIESSEDVISHWQDIIEIYKKPPKNEPNWAIPNRESYINQKLEYIEEAKGYDFIATFVYYNYTEEADIDPILGLLSNVEGNPLPQNASANNPLKFTTPSGKNVMFIIEDGH